MSIYGAKFPDENFRSGGGRQGPQILKVVSLALVRGLLLFRGWEVCGSSGTALPRCGTSLPVVPTHMKEQGHA